MMTEISPRPPNLIGKKAPLVDQPQRMNVYGGLRPASGVATRRYYMGQELKTQIGRYEDPEFLDQLSKYVPS